MFTFSQRRRIVVWISCMVERERVRRRKVLCRAHPLRFTEQIYNIFATTFHYFSVCLLRILYFFPSNSLTRNSERVWGLTTILMVSLTLCAAIILSFPVIVMCVNQNSPDHANVSRDSHSRTILFFLSSLKLTLCYLPLHHSSKLTLLHFLEVKSKNKRTFHLTPPSQNRVKFLISFESSDDDSIRVISTRKVYSFSIHFAVL